MDETTLRTAVVADPITRTSGKPKRANFKAIVLFFRSLSTAKAHGFGVKFIELNGTVGFIAIWDFSF